MSIRHYIWGLLNQDGALMNRRMAIGGTGMEIPRSTGFTREEPWYPAGVFGDHVRPWSRFWARWIDLNITTFVFGFVTAFAAPQMLDASAHVFGILTTLLHVVLEAVLLAVIGTTPGKWLLGVRLTDSEGQALTFTDALGRAFHVWWRGIGAGIPYVMVITMVSAKKRLERTGTTPWDQQRNCRVSTQPVGAMRKAMAVLLVLGFVAVTIMDVVQEITGTNALVLQ